MDTFTNVLTVAKALASAYRKSSKSEATKARFKALINVLRDRLSDAINGAHNESGRVPECMVALRDLFDNMLYAL